MSQISPLELAARADALLDRVAAGEHLTVVRAGRPIAEIRPVENAENASGPRPFGLCAGEFKTPDDFDAPLPDEVLREFEGP